jgi:hypothetical protein
MSQADLLAQARSICDEMEPNYLVELKGYITRRQLLCSQPQITDHFKCVRNLRSEVCSDPQPVKRDRSTTTEALLDREKILRNMLTKDCMGILPPLLSARDITRLQRITCTTMPSDSKTYVNER